MSLILSQISLKKNELKSLPNSNKNIFTKKNIVRKTEYSNAQNETHDKNNTKKSINHITNTSVKKHKQVKKISINDYENKNIRLKNNISPKNTKNINKSLLIKKNTLLKTKKKLDLDNKENQRNNNKDKNDHKKIIKKPLNMMIKNTKMKIKQNITQIKKNIKTQILNKNNGNKLQKYIIDIENSTERENNEEKNKKVNIINENKSFNTKEIINTNKTLMMSHNKTSYIENGKPNEEENEELEENKLINISQEDDIEYILKYEKNNKSNKKMTNVNSNVSSDKIYPSINIRDDYAKYGFKKKNENQRLNIIHRKINSEGNFLNSDVKNIYNSINNEKEKEIENGNKNINLINNFDIINIIIKKEQHKKLSRSLRNKSNHKNNNSKNIKEISSENINEQQYQYKYPITKFKLNGLNIIYNEPNDILKEKESKPDEILTAKTLRINNQINPINKSMSLVNSKRNIGQNKWNKNYAIPIVSATLTKNDGIKKEKKFFLKKKLNKKINELIEYNKYNTNPKKHINFGDNNKKKREILFNFNNDNFKYLSFRTKRTNSFIDKRNMHITERNNSINITINENDNIINTNRDVDLDIQEKKLKSICREINKYKFRKKFHNPDLYSLSLDKQIDTKLLYTDKNKDDEINLNDIKINENKNVLNSNKISKKYKTFRIKLNPLNIIKIKNDSFINGNNKLVIKRGDLLNRLRKIKQNYTKLEVTSIE